MNEKPAGLEGSLIPLVIVGNGPRPFPTTTSELIDAMLGAGSAGLKLPWL